MASGGDLRASYDKFVKGDQATSKDITKWFKDAGVLTKKTCNSNNLDIAFSKVKEKGKTKITFKQVEPLIGEVAKAYAKDTGKSEADSIAEIKDKLSKVSGPIATGVTKVSKTGGVDRMTDTSKYTGSHKERFDESGKGKGIEGREERAENKGYVSSYKGEGTFDSKTGK